MVGLDIVLFLKGVVLVFEFCREENWEIFCFCLGIGLSLVKLMKKDIVVKIVVV